MKHKEKFLCNQCEQHTKLDIKSKKVINDVKHVYAECEHCGYKSTVYYTNSKVRKLMAKQQKETDQSKKNILTEKIQKEVEILKEKYAK